MKNSCRKRNEQDRARREAKKTLKENILQPKNTPETLSAASQIHASIKFKIK